MSSGQCWKYPKFLLETDEIVLTIPMHVLYEKLQILLNN